MNAYEMMLEMRENLNEATAEHWSEVSLLRKLNAAQRFVAPFVAMASGDWLVASADLTPVASVITLPYYIAKPVYLKHASEGYEIPLDTNVRNHLTSKTGSLSSVVQGPDAYLVGSTIVINQDSYTDAVTVYYEKRVVDLAFGAAGTSSAASSLELEQAMYPKLVDDYYNNVDVEVYNASAYIRSAISDYAYSTRVATITGTPASGDSYGTISVLPEEAHPVIVAKATVMALAKPSSAIDPKYYQMFKDEFSDQFAAFQAWIAERTPGGNRVRITEGDD